MGGGERYYSASLGRFIQQDSWTGNAGMSQSLNRYAYGYNNPLRYTDPSGNEPAEGNAADVGFLWGTRIEQQLRTDAMAGHGADLYAGEMLASEQIAAATQARWQEVKNEFRRDHPYVRNTLVIGYYAVEQMAERLINLPKDASEQAYKYVNDVYEVVTDPPGTGKRKLLTVLNVARKIDEVLKDPGGHLEAAGDWLTSHSEDELLEMTGRVLGNVTFDYLLARATTPILARAGGVVRAKLRERAQTIRHTAVTAERHAVGRAIGREDLSFHGGGTKLGNRLIAGNKPVASASLNLMHSQDLFLRQYLKNGKLLDGFYDIVAHANETRAEFKDQLISANELRIHLKTQPNHKI